MTDDNRRHCWNCGPETQDGCPMVCVAPDKHDGPHVWLRADQTYISFVPLEERP